MFKRASFPFIRKSKMKKARRGRVSNREMAPSQRIPLSPLPSWATIQGKLDILSITSMRSDPRCIEPPDEDENLNQFSSDTEQEQDEVDELLSSSSQSPISPPPANVLQPSPQARSSMFSPAACGPLPLPPSPLVAARCSERSSRPPPIAEDREPAGPGGGLKPDCRRLEVCSTVNNIEALRMLILTLLCSSNISYKVQLKGLNREGLTHPYVRLRSWTTFQSDHKNL